VVSDGRAAGGTDIEGKPGQPYAPVFNLKFFQNVFNARNYEDHSACRPDHIIPTGRIFPAADRQDFLKEKIAAILQVDDIFGTGSFNFINQGAGFYGTVRMTRESRVVRLTVSFRINNYKKQNGNREEGLNGSNNMDQENGGY
jgi:hypothetical protein